MADIMNRIKFPHVDTDNLVVHGDLTVKGNINSLSGTWMFNDWISEIPSTEYINFISNGYKLNEMFLDDDILRYRDKGNDKYSVYWYYEAKWAEEAFRKITFVGVQSVSEEFYNWFTSNATFTTTDCDWQEITEYIDKEIAEFDFVKVVDVLPEEGLPNREYFVRKDSPDTNDLFDEYAWINSGTDEQPIWGWEFKGTKTMEIDLSEYINKNNLGSAFRIASDGNLNLVCASKAQIDNQINAQNPITPSTISYAVKVGLTANTETLTDEEKDEARNWLGISTEKEITDYIDKEIAEFDFVKVVDELPEEGLPNREYFVRKNSPDTNDLFDEYAWINSGTEEEPNWGWEFKGTKTMEIDLSEYINKNKLGSAFHITSDGNLNLVSATKAYIQNQAVSYIPIAPNNLSYAVKVGLTANREELTEEEKAAVCAWIGAKPSGGYTVRIECEPNRAPIYISKHFPTSPEDYDAVLPMSEDDENQYLTLTDVKQLWFWDAENLPGLCATSNGRYLFYNYYTDYCGFDSSEYDEATGGDVKAVYKNTFRVFEDMTVYITHIYE